MLAIICAVFSVCSFVISVLQFKEKGFLFNNAYLWASQNERNLMNKKPYYRQSGIVFSWVGIIFCMLTVDAIVNSDRIGYIVFGMTVLMIVFAIVSSVSIEKKHIQQKPTI